MSEGKVTIESLTRQEQLLVWMYREKMSQADIAAATGTTKTSVARWLSAETLPPYRHEQLVNMGIPAELLPPAEYKTGGRAAASAQN